MLQDRFPSRLVGTRFGLFAVLGLVWLAIEPATALAQFERYELGRRLREFEVEWDRVNDPRAKARACQSLKSAVDAFLSLRLGEAGRAITEAQFALRPGVEANDAERWARSLCVKPEGRLIDSSTSSLSVTIAAFYSTAAKSPENPTIRLILGGSNESRVEANIGRLPMTLSLPIKGLAAGDHLLVAEIRSGEKILARASQTISLADQLDDRLTALRKTISGWPEDAESATADRESARSQLRLLESLAAKMTLESDFPANQLLLSVEEQALAADQSEPYLGKDRAGQAWVTVVTRTGRRVATRLFVPEAAAKGEPLTIVVALHRAGGSENMFFESYGHGAIVDRCRERGWLLVAPRSTAYGDAPVAEIVDELAKLYPVDLKRVMLVGHSKGAGQGVAAVLSQPTRYAAVAALGGGAKIPFLADLKDQPFFIGVGSEDDALKDAKDLAESLKKVSASPVIFREYPNVEHLAIVQVALPDVFRFFDEQAKAKAR